MIDATDLPVATHRALQADCPYCEGKGAILDAEVDIGVGVQEHWVPCPECTRVVKLSTEAYRQGAREQQQEHERLIKQAHDIETVLRDASVGSGSLVEGVRRLVQKAEEGAREAREQWQPIETAPKDDTAILVANIVNGALYRVSDATFAYVGWFTRYGGVGCSWATHWTPLPDPPAAALRASAPPSPSERK